MALYRSFLTVGFFTIFSRIVGFVREVLIASMLGAGASSDALKIAMRLPSMFRRLTAEGAFNVSFVPMFAALLSSPNGKAKAQSFAEDILSWLVVILVVFVIVVELFLPQLFPLLAPGFQSTPERMELAIEFTRITFPFILFISLCAFYSGILNSIDRFAVAASSPMIGNLFIVGVVWAFVGFTTESGYLFSWAVLGCGVVQFLWVMFPAFKHGYTFKLHLPTMTPNVRKFFKRMGPAALGTGVVQVNLLIDTIIASYLPEGGMSYLDYADRLNQLPLSVIGTAAGTALLPLMSRQIAAGNKVGAIESQTSTLEFALLLSLPSACGLMIWAAPLIALVFETGKFTHFDTLATADALVAFGSGLPAYIMIKIFSTTFFAQHDTRTPVYVAVGSVVLNVILNLSLIGPLQHVGLALATSIAAWMNALTLGFILTRRGYFEITPHLQAFSWKLLASLAMVVPILTYFKPYLNDVGSYSFLGKLFIIVFVIGGAVGAFALAAYVTGALDIPRLKAQFRKPKNRESHP